MKKFLLSLLGVITCICAQATDYKLVTSASDLEAGANYIIVASSNKTTWYAMSSTQNTNNFQNVTISAPVDNVVTITTETVCVIELESYSYSDSKYPYRLKVADSSKYLYAASTSKNHLKTTSSHLDAATASITIASSGNAATIKFNNSGANIIKFNASNNPPIFSCYSSGQQPVYLYKEVTTSGDGEDTKDCGIAFTSASGEVTYPGTDYVLPFKNDNKVDVTFTSTEARVVTVANEDNRPKLTINGCGTTTITASFAGNTTYEAKEVSFDLTVNQGTPALSFAKTSYTANLGEAFDLPELAGVPDGATISWTSTASDVAEFVDGVLNIKAAGATTIKATTSATDLYTEGNASFSLNVVDPNDKSVKDVVSADAFNTTTGTSYTDVTYTSSATGAVYSAKVVIEKKSNVNTFRINDSSKSFFCVSTASTNCRLSKIVFHKVYGSKSVKIYASTSAYTADVLSSGTNPGGTLIKTLDTPTGDYTIDFTTDKDPNGNLLKDAGYVAFYVVGPGGQTNFSSIDVTWEPLSEEELADAKLSFDNATDNATYGTDYTPQTLTNPKGVAVTWSSSATDVAEFNGSKLIINKAGTTTITASATDDKYTTNNTAFYTLTIAKGDPTAFAYAQATYDYVMGDNFSAPTLKIPEGLTVASYLSSDTEVATVNDEGVITPVSRGTAIITAHTDGNDCWNAKNAELTINITKKIPTLSFKDTEVSLFVEKATSYAGQILNVTPNDLTVTYALNNEATIGTIEAETGNLVLNGTVGTATVKATTTETSVYESRSASYTIEVKKHVTELSFAQAEVEVKLGEKYAGQTASCTIEESLKEGFTITYASSNEAVATVDANTGAVTLTGAEGTATITAAASGNTYYTPATASYTITVAKQYVYADTKVTLVKDANTLNPGDIIVIANQDASVAMSTSSSNATKRGQTDVTLSPDKSEITYLPDNALLLELHQVEVVEVVENKETTSYYWTLNALNFSKEGVLYCGTSSNDLKLGVPQSTNVEKSYAKITINPNNEAIIKLNKGTGTTSSNINLIMYNNNDNGKSFSCYNNTQQPVYIYKVETPVIIDNSESPEDASMVWTPVQGNNSLTASSTFYTLSTASEYVVKVNGVAIPAIVDASTDGIREVTIEGLPYLPGAEFTIAPVVNGKEGHSEVLGIQMPELPVLDFTSKKMELFFDSEAYKDATTCSLDAWVFLTVDMKDATSGQPLVEADPRRNLTFSFEEFDNSQEGVEIYGWYTPYKEVQWCKYNYFTNVDVEDGQPNTAKLNNDQTISLTFNAYFTFNVSSELASLIPTSTSAPMAAPARAGEAAVIQTVSQATPLTYSEKLPESLSSIVSGVESVTVDANAPVEFFNLQGVRVDGALAPGIYIRRQGQSVSKIQIR